MLIDEFRGNAYGRVYKFTRRYITRRRAPIVNLPKRGERIVVARSGGKKIKSKKEREDRGRRLTKRTRSWPPRWVTPDRKVTEAQKPDETCNWSVERAWLPSSAKFKYRCKRFALSARLDMRLCEIVSGLYTLIGDPYYEESLVSPCHEGKGEKLKSLRRVESFAASRRWTSMSRGLLYRRRSSRSIRMFADVANIDGFDGNRFHCDGVIEILNSRLHVACEHPFSLGTCYFNEDNVMDPLRAWRST